MITEADTCRKYVLPRLYQAGWSDDQISEQKYFTDGRIVPVIRSNRFIIAVNTSAPSAWTTLQAGPRLGPPRVRRPQFYPVSREAPCAGARK